jgi:hypothetical protein
LTGSVKIPQKKPDPVIKDNVIKQLREVYEGWQDKLTAANIGFGIVVALIIVSVIAGCILFGINQSRVNRQRDIIRNLQKELDELDKLI